MNIEVQESVEASRFVWWWRGPYHAVRNIACARRREPRQSACTESSVCVCVAAALTTGRGGRRGSASEVPFAVMQPPFDEFQPVLTARPDRVNVLVNGNKPLKLGLQVGLVTPSPLVLPSDRADVA